MWAVAIDAEHAATWREHFANQSCLQLGRGNHQHPLTCFQPEWEYCCHPAPCLDHCLMWPEDYFADKLRIRAKDCNPCRLAVYAYRQYRIVKNSSADPSYSRSIPSRSVLEFKIGSHSLFPHTTLIMSFFQRVLGSDTFGRQHRCPAVTDSPKTLPCCRRWPLFQIARQYRSS